TAVIIAISVLTLFSCQPKGMDNPVQIKVSKEVIEMGKCVVVDAVVNPGDKRGRMVLLPFVNGKRWGSHEFASEDDRATFIIPLPNPGPATIQVIALAADRDDWMGIEDYSLLQAGTFMPEKGIRSNSVLVEVKNRDFLARSEEETLFAMQWEPWFTPGRKWITAQAIPLTGLYESTNPDVTRQHILWFMDMGVDFIIPDWSNHIWGREHWSERGGGADQILHCTQMFLEVLADMRDEGLPVPRVAIMPGLTNGPPATMVALNEQVEWIYQDYIRNPRFEGLWQIYEGKPLIIILDTGVLAHKEGRTESSFRIPFFKQTMAWSEEEVDAFRQKQGPVDDSHFTVRWMSSQNQTTLHHDLGYWSWMDGSLSPTVTYKNGKAESTTVTPAFFAEQGWKAPEAYGRRGGWTYLESFKTALEHRPRIVMLHQFNEYTGQAEGHGYGPDKKIYVDSYSNELSDDLEPVSLTAPGFRGDQGGWGYYYLNLTKAMMDIYRGNVDDVTLLAVHVADSTGSELVLEWTTIGIDPDSYTVAVDGEIVADGISDLTINIPMADLSPGEHNYAVTANGVGTRYELSFTEFDQIAEQPMPVVVEKTFFVK
ncbi:MAG: hypothetical protein KAH12_04585, partial [Anaerolineales bacterium]|nr:hypothetical protein [Anaerolineales bacterium]